MHVAQSGHFWFSAQQGETQRLLGQQTVYAKLDDGRHLEYTEMCGDEATAPSGDWPDYQYLGHGRFCCHGTPD
jgi:hypothetical protein